MKLLTLPRISFDIDSVNIIDNVITHTLTTTSNEIKFDPINVQFDDFSEMINFIHNRNKDRNNPWKIISEKITIDDYDFMELDIDTINVNKLTAVLTYSYARKRKTK